MASDSQALSAQVPDDLGELLALIARHSRRLATEIPDERLRAHARTVDVAVRHARNLARDLENGLSRPATIAAVGQGGARGPSALEVAIVDDKLAVRRGIELLLRDGGMNIAGTAAGPDEARALLRAGTHDVALIDVDVVGGEMLARELLARDPEAAIVLYTTRIEASPLRATLRIGTRGVVLKRSPPERLMEALRKAALGERYVDPAIGERLVVDDPKRVLSARQREVLVLLADGLTAEQAAERLCISRETLRTHVRNAMRKLGVKTRVQAVALVMQGRD